MAQIARVARQVGAVNVTIVADSYPTGNPAQGEAITMQERVTITAECNGLSLTLTPSELAEGYAPPTLEPDQAAFVEACEYMAEKAAWVFSTRLIATVNRVDEGMAQ